ncbi:hypothetical protein F5J12DRAFT_893661 [Pisolithus orientalis]|uniref:uncharacterized protein n=1 Tax=Pisolithus orientalis TaxID=936130 RepID=UPI002224067B|nr:uncharacterized protein F5J12DRAFT_893661 [Pisolithus orientalis]KAI6003473.1 hypothetical protein F5J12DRAFT_893661 [Pisolithus orientalis]
MIDMLEKASSDLTEAITSGAYHHLCHQQIGEFLAPPASCLLDHIRLKQEEPLASKLKEDISDQEKEKQWHAVELGYVDSGELFKEAMLMPLVERGKELGVMVRVDAAEVPILAEVDDVYEQWMVEEAEVCARAEQDVQMGDENAQETRGLGASVAVPAATEKMSHVEVVSHLVWKQSQQTVAESKDEDEPKIIVPPGSILHKVPCTWCMVKKTACIRPIGQTCDGCTRMKQGCEKLMKAMGKKAQAGTSVTQASKTAKASLSKRVVDDDDDDDEVKVVESHMRAKGKAPVCSQLDAKVAVAEAASC